MANTSPQFTQSSFATGALNYPVLLNDLNSNYRSFTKSLIRKYGNENYALIQMALGNSVDIDFSDNKQFYHYEKRQLHSSVSVAADVARTGPGASITLTVGSDSYYEGGNKSPIRVFETVLIVSSGQFAQITAINQSVAGAHTFTLTPLNTADNLSSAGSTSILATEVIAFRGATNVGEASSKIAGMAPVYDKIFNTTTEHRDDFNVTDVASIEKQEVVLGKNGQQYYTDLALDDLNMRYLNDGFFKCMEGVSVNNIANTFGTIGVIPRVKANGSTVQYAAGAPTIADFHTLSRNLNYFGSAGEYHMLQDMLSKQAISDLLFTTYKNTFNAASYESVGGSKEASAAYGFDTLRIDNITYHLFSNPMFNTTQVYKRATPIGDAYKYFSLLIPQRVNQDPKMGTSYPSFQLVFQKTKNGDRIQTWETGGMANANKTDKAERNIHMLSYPGVRVFAANQYAIFQGV